MADRKIIVTGGGAGIGEAIVREFARLGDVVVAGDIRLDSVRRLEDELGTERVRALTLDASDAVSMSTFIAKAVDSLGGVDVLCNNAGILDDYLNAIDTSLELWNRIISTNLTSQFVACHDVIPHMIAQGGGVIVNTASISAQVAGGGGAAYTASKHGVLGLTRQLAFDFGKQGIRVNAICPGATRTNMTAHLFTEEGRNEHVDEAIASIPAGRWAEPEEMAKLVAFLASNDSSYIQGTGVIIDGGMTVA